MTESPLDIVKNVAYFRNPISAILVSVNINAEQEIMKRFLIERDIQGVGSLSREQLKDAAATSNQALGKLAGKVQWRESYVVNDKTYCIYLAESEELVHEHARLSGFPASKVTEVRRVIDPMTGIS